MLQLYRFFAKRLFKLAVRTFTATTASIRSNGLEGSNGAEPFAIYHLLPVVDPPVRDDAPAFPDPSREAETAELIAAKDEVRQCGGGGHRHVGDRRRLPGGL